MKTRITLLLSLSILLTSSSWVQAQAADSGADDHTLTLYVNQAKVSLDGISYASAQPTVVLSGTTYAPISMLGARLGYSVGYDSKTKESIVKLDGSEIRWKSGSSSYTENGKETTFTGKPFNQNGSLMIPVRAWANATGALLSTASGQVILNWTTELAPASDAPTTGTEPGNTPPADTPPAGSPTGGTPVGTGAGDQTLTLYMNQSKVSLNGVSYPSAQPTVVKSGTTYAPISMLGARFGYSVGYDSKTKESITRLGSTEIRWKSGSSIYKVNGTAKAFTGKPYSENGSLMIPVRAWASATEASLSTAAGQVILKWNTAHPPTADFTVDTTEIHAGQTPVVYTSHSENAKYIKAERWETDGVEGQLTVFTTPGVHTVTRSVQGEDGEWSEPYSVTVNVLPPNEAPHALFTTTKDTYKMGEKIEYTDQSTDDENAIVTTEWGNNKPAFFTPGDQVITLRVTDKHGASSEYSRTIHISTELLYTEDQFNKLFTPVGEIYTMDGTTVPKYPSVPYTYTISPRQLIASDSPENLVKEGILYSDTVEGDFRLFLYHMNSSSDPLTIYLAATNTGTQKATVSLGSTGQAGPNAFGLWTGKLAAERYLESRETGNTTTTTLAPGETKLIMPQLGNLPLKYSEILSAYADLNASQPVKFTLFAIKKDSRDPLSALNKGQLGVLPRDGVHIRGTFQGADREIMVNQMLGTTTQRVLFGDHVNDPALDGIDMLSGAYENNWGNFGVVYHMNVQVAPNTLIAVNGRGGLYSGVFKVNDTAVKVSNTNYLQNSNQVSVLYRTGANAETVDLSFLTALGSNLPMNILFIPMDK